MSDDTPIYTDTAFHDIVSREFLSDMEPAGDSEVRVYGCRVLFYMTADPDVHMSLLIPWLTYKEEDAHTKRSEIAHRMSGYRLRGFLRYDVTVWTPLAVRVVQLAEIPF